MAINLLPQDLQKEHAQRDKKTLVVTVSVVLLLLFGALAGILFSYRVFSTRQLDEVTLKFNDVNKQVEKYRLTEGVLRAVKLKLEKLDDIFDTRYPYDRILQQIQAAATEKVEIIEVNVTDGNQMEVSGKAQALIDLADYLRFLEGSEEAYHNFELSKIAFDANDFRYSFVLDFEYLP